MLTASSHSRREPLIAHVKRHAAICLIDACDKRSGELKLARSVGFGGAIGEVMNQNQNQGGQQDQQGGGGQQKPGQQQQEPGRSGE
jgi:hypothetical protein